MRIPFGKTSAAIIVAGSIALAQEPPKPPIEGGAPDTPTVPAKSENAAIPANSPSNAKGYGSVCSPTRCKKLCERIPFHPFLQQKSSCCSQPGAPCLCRRVLFGGYATKRTPQNR